MKLLVHFGKLPPRERKPQIGGQEGKGASEPATRSATNAAVTTPIVRAQIPPHLAAVVEKVKIQA